jgi:arylsulfatase A-like enzyme
VAFNAVHAPLESNKTYEQRVAGIVDPRRRTYAGMLVALDDAIDRIMGALRERGLAENTLVFFYSDNGGPTQQTTSRNNPLRGVKGQMFEGGIRVPFAMQWQGTLPAGVLYRESVMGFDVHATALAAAGIETPAKQPLDGVNLLPFLTGARTVRHTTGCSGGQQGARMGEWKLVTAANSASMLFNLRTDISETRDLAASNPAKLRELQDAFRRWAADKMPARQRQDARNAEPARRARVRRDTVRIPLPAGPLFERVIGVSDERRPALTVSPLPT